MAQRKPDKCPTIKLRFVRWTSATRRNAEKSVRYLLGPGWTLRFVRLSAASPPGRGRAGVARKERRSSIGPIGVSIRSPRKDSRTSAISSAVAEAQSGKSEFLFLPSHPFAQSGDAPGRRGDSDRSPPLRRGGRAKTRLPPGGGSLFAADGRGGQSWDSPAASRMKKSMVVRTESSIETLGSQPSSSLALRIEGLRWMTSW